MGREVSIRKSRSLGSGSEGIMEIWCQALCRGERGGQREQDGGPRAFQTRGWKGLLRSPNVNQCLARSPSPGLGP